MGTKIRSRNGVGLIGENDAVLNTGEEYDTGKAKTTSFSNQCNCRFFFFSFPQSPWETHSIIIKKIGLIRDMRLIFPSMILQNNSTAIYPSMPCSLGSCPMNMTNYFITTLYNEIELKQSLRNNIIIAV